MVELLQQTIDLRQLDPGAGRDAALAGTIDQLRAPAFPRPSDRATLSSSMDDLGNFEFEDVPAGLYALEIDLPGAQVVIEELHLD